MLTDIIYIATVCNSLKFKGINLNIIKIFMCKHIFESSNNFYVYIKDGCETEFLESQ